MTSLVYACPSYRLSFEDEPSEPPASLAQEEVDTPPELITMPSRFEQVQERGYIDVWWIYDDGGQYKLMRLSWSTVVLHI